MYHMHHIICITCICAKYICMYVYTCMYMVCIYIYVYSRYTHTSYVSYVPYFIVQTDVCLKQTLMTLKLYICICIYIPKYVFYIWKYERICKYTAKILKDAYEFCSETLKWFHILCYVLSELLSSRIVRVPTHVFFV